jgi:hypothetical protein
VLCSMIGAPACCHRDPLGLRAAMRTRQEWDRLDRSRWFAGLAATGSNRGTACGVPTALLARDFTTAKESRCEMGTSMLLFERMPLAYTACANGSAEHLKA